MSLYAGSEVDSEQKGETKNRGQVTVSSDIHWNNSDRPRFSSWTNRSGLQLEAGARPVTRAVH